MSIIYGKFYAVCEKCGEKFEPDSILSDNICLNCKFDDDLEHLSERKFMDFIVSYCPENEVDKIWSVSPMTYKWEEEHFDVVCPYITYPTFARKPVIAWRIWIHAIDENDALQYGKKRILEDIPKKKSGREPLFLTTA